jgi:two-component system sensor histidine kinase/response regulator
LWPFAERLINFIHNEESSDTNDSGRTINLWRQRVFFAAFITAILGGLLSFLPTLIAGIKEGLWTTIIGYSLIYLVCLGVVFVRVIPFYWRMALGLSVIFIAGVLNLNLAGLMGSGRIWLFFFSIIASVLLGVRLGLIALALNVGTLVVFYWLLDERVPVWQGLLADHSYAKAWVLTSNTFTFLNLVAIISSALVVKGLKASMYRSQELQTEVERKKNRVEEINETLRNEVKERRRAEKHLLLASENLEDINRELEAQISERHRAEERLHGLNQCLLSFGIDPVENINSLTGLCGRLLGADFALYNRLEGETLHSVGRWNTPQDFKSEKEAEGHICLHMIQSDSRGPLVVTNLPESPYAGTDPGITAYGLKTYAGHPVVAWNKTRGALCVVYKSDAQPGPDDLEFLAAVATAVGVEEMRWRSERRVRDSRQQIEAVLDTVDTGIVLIDKSNHHIVNLNPAAAAAIGANKEQIMGHVCHGLICEAKIGECPITDKGEQLDQSERILVTASGERCAILKSATTLMLGGREHILESFMDITDRKQAEESLRLSEEKYRSILEQMEDGYFEVDLSGNFTFLNDSVCRITEYSREELEGTNYQKYIEPELASNIFNTFNRVYQTGRPSKSAGWQFRSKSGKIRHFKTTVFLMTDSDGEPMGFKGVTQDVTKRQEADLLRKEKLKAELASQAKSQFLANMSHEIRTPINGIIGMAEVVRATHLDDDQRRYVDVINSEADSLLGIINDVLDFSKLEAGRLDLEQIPFDLAVTLEELADSLAHRAARRGLDFSVYASLEIPSLLLGDPGRLRQIINNLAVNALKFTPSGEITIRGTLQDDLGDRVRVRFEVEDTGVGIPLEKQAAIFDSFTQADASTTRLYGGTGLGTTIAKQLVEVMGGEIGVESVEGKGSVFWAEIEFQKSEESHSMAEIQKMDLEGFKALVVDDRAKERFILESYLAFWGCDTHGAASGHEAIDALSEMSAKGEPPDVILVDIRMPGLDGFELSRLIREQEIAPGIPIIAMSSTASLGDGERCRQMGIEGYLTKPIKNQELYRVVVSVLGLSPKSEMNADIAAPKPKQTAQLSKNASILVVEDYPTNQLVVANHLKRVGIDFEIAQDGHEGVRAFERGCFDLILMDVQMPVMDGYQATMRIRDIEKKRNLKAGGSNEAPSSHIPIIAMTAHAIKGYRDKCLAVGMDDYITKPFRKSDLFKIINRWGLAGSQPRSATGAGVAPPTETGSRNEAPLKFDQAVEEFEGDEELVKTLLDEFLATARGQIDEMREALEQGKAEPVGIHAHSIKGAAGNITAFRLSVAAAKIEKQAKEGRLDGMNDLLDKLDDELRELVSHVHTLPLWADGLENPDENTDSR